MERSRASTFGKGENWLETLFTHYIANYGYQRQLTPAFLAYLPIYLYLQKEMTQRSLILFYTKKRG